VNEVYAGRDLEQFAGQMAIEPTPDGAIVILPGLALAKSINSGTLLAATDGSTSRT